MKYLITTLLFLFFGLLELSAQNPSEVFIQQANVEHNEAVLQFTGDFTTAFSGKMGLESFDEYESDTNGIGNGAHRPRCLQNAVNYLEG